MPGRQHQRRHALVLRVVDLRAGLQELAIGQGQGKAGAKAPVRFIYVVDIEKFAKAGFQEPGLWNTETQKAYFHVDTGLIAGNVYLFAASHGLAAWFHNCNREELHRKLALTNRKRALFGQTIGYAETEPGRVDDAQAPDEVLKCLQFPMSRPPS